MRVTLHFLSNYNAMVLSIPQNMLKYANLAPRKGFQVEVTPTLTPAPPLSRSALLITADHERSCQTIERHKKACKLRMERINI
jgi:hypothetical protein